MSNDSLERGNYRQRLYDAYVRSGQAELIRDASDLDKRSAYLRDLIARHFPKNPEASILDLGCGSGALLHFAREAGFRSLRGVDTSAEQVAGAKALGLDCVEQGDLRQALAKLPPRSVDVIVAFDVLEHFGKSEVLEFFDLAHAGLAGDGRFIIHVPNAEGPFVGAVRYGDFTHELAFTRHSLAQIAFACGFARVDCFEEKPVPHGLKSTVRRGLWSMLHFLFRLFTAIETGDTGRDAVFSRSMLAVVRKHA